MIGMFDALGNLSCTYLNRLKNNSARSGIEPTVSFIKMEMSRRYGDVSMVMLDHSNLNSSDQYQLLNCQSQIEITTNSTKNLKQS